MLGFGMMRKILFLLIIFIVIAGFLIVRSNDLDLTSPKDIKLLAKGYVSWTGMVVGNTARITVDVINMDWLPEK